MIVSGSKRALGRASEDRSLVAALAAVVVVVVAMVPVPALASPSCLTSANKCEADALCTFKEELAAKVLTYQMYLKNAKRTKELKSRDGVAYDGTLYKQALAEAMKSFHNSSRAEQRVKAGQIFQELLEKYVKENFEIPTCRANGKLDKKLLPKPGYDGMYTDSKCLIWVKFDAGEVDPKGFASGKQETTCQEFYNRDLAHEVVHQKNCKAAKHAGKTLDDIDDVIEDEVQAYRNSVIESEAYVKLLTLLCTTSPKPSIRKTRAKTIQTLLRRYATKGG